MSFGKVSTAPCINVSPPADARCLDPAFALANPSVCPVAPQLIIKPAVVLSCSLGSVQFKAFYVQGNTETDVTDQTVFQSSDPNIAVVGAASGNATGLSTGTVTISAVYLGKTALAEMEVLGDNCCDEIVVATMVVIDRSKSMSQAFNSTYGTKLVYAKAAATRFISETCPSKDLIGLMQFTGTSNEVLSAPVANRATVQPLIAGIVQTSQSTTLFDALTTAVAQLAAIDADRKMIVLISDGEDQDPTYLDDSNPIALMSDFKTGGGIVLCLGVRAHDRGYALLSALATGGFFINSYDATNATARDYLSGLKGYVCSGNCTPTGDEYKASGSLNYCQFEKWNVVDGHVDLIGNGFMDLLPGNGLYVDLAGSRSPYKGTMVTKETIAVETDKQYRLSFQLAGNQRVNATPNSVRARVFSRNNDGLDNPANPPGTVIATGSGSADLESYDYAVSYLNANGETELSGVASEDNGSFETFLISLTADAMPTASVARFWKRPTGTDTWYLIAEADPTAPAFDDTLNNAALAAAVAAGTINSCDQPSETNTTGTPIDLLNQVLTLNNFQQGFQAFSYTFVAPGDADVYISLQETETPTGYDATGLLLDSVTFSDVTDIVDLFTDDFDGENMQYVPPACGIGTNYVLLNPETAFEESAIPPMTSNTEPSGIASSGTSNQSPDNAFYVFDGTKVDGWFGSAPPDENQWIQYQFPSAKVITSYRMASNFASTQGAPSAWVFQGSNNGSDWTTLDSQSGVTSWVNDVPKSFAVATPGSYLYYRITFTAVMDADEPSVTFCVRWTEMLVGGNGDPIYGYISGYDCCEGCLDEPPAAQAEDPDPLPDIESGYTPPQVFTSTKTVCVECPDGFENNGDNLVPVMTGYTAPSGQASANAEYTGSGPAYAWMAFDDVPSSGWTPTITFGSGDLPAWLQYKFAAAQTIVGYSIRNLSSATGYFSDWTFQGSNDGSTWTDLDSQATQYFGAGQTKQYAFSNSTAYLYYRVYFTGFAGGVYLGVARLEMFGSANTQVCATATATSEISQGDADTQATAVATSAANLLLNCIGAYTATESYPAACPVGTFGTPVTKTVTIVSFISLLDAQQRAAAEAQALAEAQLDCTKSNNNQPITISDRSASASGPATALPYPSVRYVENVTGPITKVTASLTGFSHGFPDDCHVVLLSPEGTAVTLFRNSGGNNAASGLNFVFDDAAGSFLPDSTALSSGTFKPSPNGVEVPMPSPFPATQPYATTLAAFIGENGNGSWSLWIIDDQTGGTGTLNSWDLTISP